MTAGSESQSTPGSELFKNEPLYDETMRLFHYVSTRDLEELKKLCDDDFGIVDIDPEGKTVVIPDRTSWEKWYNTLFAQLKEVEQETFTEILDYKVSTSPNLAWSAVEFCQHLKVQGQPMKYFCVATIIWKNTPASWKEARWHCSLVEGPVPA